MRFIYFAIVCLTASLCLSACDVSITPGGIEDRHKPKVIEDLAPLPDGVLNFAAETSKLFFSGGRAAINDRLHPAMRGLSNVKWTAMEKFAADNPDWSAMEYYGHGFGEDEGISFVVVQLKVPYENGYNLVKLTMPTEEDCCRLAGLEVHREMSKTFNLGK